MKNKILLIPALMCALSAFAIDEGQEMTSGVHGGGSNLFPHFNPQSGNSNTQLWSRLKARTSAFFDGSQFRVLDSTSYTFSSGRGGYTTPDAPNVDEKVYFDESYTLTKDKITGIFFNKMHRTQIYHPDNKVYILTYQEWYTNTSQWDDSMRYIYDYQNGLMTSTTLQLGIGGWTSHGNPSQMQYTNNKMVSLQSDFFKMEFQYNSANQLEQTVDRELVSGIWYYNEKNSYEYAGSNLKRHVLEKYNVQTNQWEKVKSLEYEYDAGQRVLSITEKSWDGSAFVNKVKNEFTYDASNNKSTDILSEWNGSSFEPKTKENWEYNSNNQVTLITTQTWASGAWAYTMTDLQFTYYYEVYFPTSVTALTGGKSLNVYPIPASDNLTLSINAEKSSVFSFSVVDMKGSVIRSWTDLVAGSYQQSIPVNDLPAGAYFIKAQNKDAVHTERFTVAR